ncbi:helix-turn-helix domain-containing protein [Novosphingobium sp. PP1Y]|uniref:helix-turn-helix domain-containing protein n=1 Tax=Novosphingobium sp. PP1Y TaxID=702113 RepID=UPI00020EF8F1|nr:AraC family transcriptional regulator [Novosphingobium sp. PP1Y]CCA90769.1 AraC family transcriptional regulator [Novosphingobium sp. PP1Y]
MYQEFQSLPPGETQSSPFQQAVFSMQIVSLLAGARRSLDEDLNLARHYLDQLSALFESDFQDDIPEGVLLPQRLSGTMGLTKGGLASWQVRRVTEHIEDRLDKPLITEDLATVARLSTGHFCRAFKASMGETPHSYIIRQRLRRAQTLMLKTRDTLSQIACACGLTDQAHLTRLFRRNIGTTPMTWRRDWQLAA